MRKLSIVSVGLACLCMAAASGEALAKPRRAAPAVDGAAGSRQPLVVEKRSFLDPGTKVPVGSTNRYVLQQTFYNQDPIRANQRSWYGGETLPNRLNQPWDEGVPIDFLP